MRNLPRVSIPLCLFISVSLTGANSTSNNSPNSTLCQANYRTECIDNPCTDGAAPSCEAMCDQQCGTGVDPNQQQPTDTCNNGMFCTAPKARLERTCYCASGTSCKLNAEACSTGSECCSGVCNTSFWQCVEAQTCKNVDVACEQDIECCSGICNDQTYKCATSESPILIDVAGNGFALTDSNNGVLFDLRGSGELQRVAWTYPDSDDAWLALDRDGDGFIDSGLELFGNSTEQPFSTAPNGFAALSVFDLNRDNWIDAADEIYAHLRLWTDSNHDGISQRAELRTLGDTGLLRLSLDVKESERRDRNGNKYRYRAKIVTANPSDGGPFAYDVFLLIGSVQGNKSTIPAPWLRKQ
jgi:hypothetical protein